MRRIYTPLALLSALSLTGCFNLNRADKSFSFTEHKDVGIVAMSTVCEHKVSYSFTYNKLNEKANKSMGVICSPSRQSIMNRYLKPGTYQITHLERETSQYNGRLTEYPSNTPPIYFTVYPQKVSYIGQFNFLRKNKTISYGFKNNARHDIPVIMQSLPKIRRDAYLISLAKIKHKNQQKVY